MRHVSVTAARKAKALAALRRYPSERAAAKEAGVCHKTLQHWRKFDPVYAEKFEEALMTGVGRLEEAVMYRAIDGVDSYVVSQGKVVLYEGKPLIEKKFSDALAAKLLEAHGGEKYKAKKSDDSQPAAIIIFGGVEDEPHKD